MKQVRNVKRQKINVRQYKKYFMFSEGLREKINTDYIETPSPSLPPPPPPKKKDTLEVRHFQKSIYS